ncbi:glycosyltransferase [Microvirga sp. STS02]|uniref:glycosyltransferase n=1 Tax=Hymenobacter negativus TaxID=2795026 RepID=UPI0018DBFA18|nr:MULTISPECIES: glycosyltransferase [Bacteria]MBH8567827.1 glycosyltransferase [Hymenobacter negativus]MBR7207563.1 glycosyltransferase [Microvirga sp. STS02]
MTNSDSRPRLLIVIPNRGMGGAQRAFHDHSVELGKYYQVTEVIFNEDEADMYPSGNPVRSLGVPGGGSPLAKIQNFWQRVTRLRELKKELNCDVSVSHLEGADYINLLSKGREKAIVLIQGSKVHDRNINGAVGMLRKKVLMPWLYQRADKMVTVSRDIIPEMTETFGVPRHKLSAINNSFEVEHVRQLSLEPLDAAMQAVYESAPVLVTSGRLAIQKNQAPLLDVFAALLKRKPAKLVFIGDGELRQDLLDHARKLGLRVYQAMDQPAPLTPDFDVYFVGLQQNPFKFIRPATAFVFPSAWEGFPLALGEAMTCGVPVVSTDCPTGPREMLAPTVEAPKTPLRQAEWAEFGILMPMLTEPASLSADIACWTDTLEQLLNDAPARQRLGEAARLRSNDFTHKRIFGQWKELIDGLLNRKARA